MVTGTTRNWASGKHHHRMGGLAAVGGERGEIFSVPWKGEAAAIEHGLADRIGDHGARLAVLDETHCLLDRLLHGGDRGRVGPARHDGAGNADRQHGKLLGEAPFRSFGFGDSGDRNS